MDWGDKGTPKAMSVAFRTFLLQALCIPTDEPDPDAQVYERDATRSSRCEDLVAWPATRSQLTALHAALTKPGLTARPDKLTFVGGLVGREIGTSSELTSREAGMAIEVVRAQLAEGKESAPGAPDAG